MLKLDLKNVIWEEGKYYVAQCLNVDVSSFGSTKREALANLYEALELYFEDDNKEYFIKVGNPQLVNTSLRCA